MSGAAQGRTDRVGIVVASRDRRATLLQSLPRHVGLPERPPIVVVDDGSTDGTAQAVARAHPEVDVIRLERSAGGAARNVGLRAIDTPYVALTDDDAWWQPGALDAAADLLDRHPALAVINARILVGADQHEDPTCTEMQRSPLPRAKGQPGYPLLSFIACAAVVRRDAVCDAGGFCERLRTGGEEQLLGWDLAAAGWQLSYVPGIVAHHHPPPAPDGRPRRRETTIRNALWTTWLRRPATTAMRLTAREVRGLPADRVTLRAVSRAIAGSPWVIRQRRVSPMRVEAMRRLLDEDQRRSARRRPARRAPR